MNPEENQLTPTTPTPAEPEVAGTTANPEATVASLDQVAADLAVNPLPEVSENLESTSQVGAPSADLVGSSEPSPLENAAPQPSEPQISPDTSSIAEPSPVAEPSPATESSTITEPSSVTKPSAMDYSATETTPLEPAQSPIQDQTMPAAEPAVEGTSSPLEPESTSITSANFVGDAPEPLKAASEPSEEEEPLRPADPVPGSIGSALVYSETAPDHALPVSELKKQHKKMSMGLSKNNVRTMLMIVAAVALVAALVVVLIFIFGGSGSKKNNASTSTNSKPAVTTPVVSSLTCTKEGVGELFSDYGEVTYGEENIIAMYTDDELTSLGSNTSLEYNSIEAAEAGLNIARGNYTTRLEGFGILSDPFASSYDVNGTSLTITHQAEADDIDSKSGKIFGLMTVRGEVVTDSETLQDSYEEDGYQCVAK